MLIVIELKESGQMSEELVYKLRSCGGVAPRIYGLAKVQDTSSTSPINARFALLQGC